MLEQLPTEILIKIFETLNINQAVHLGQTNKYLYAVYSSDYLWKRLYKRDFFNSLEIFKKPKCYKNLYKHLSTYDDIRLFIKSILKDNRIIELICTQIQDDIFRYVILVSMMNDTETPDYIQQGSKIPSLYIKEQIKEIVNFLDKNYLHILYQIPCCGKISTTSLYYNCYKCNLRFDDDYCKHCNIEMKNKYWCGIIISLFKKVPFVNYLSEYNEILSKDTFFYSPTYQLLYYPKYQKILKMIHNNISISPWIEKLAKCHLPNLE
jgi:hypothetical protein